MDRDAGATRRTRITDRDLRLLSFIAEQRLVLAAHVRTFLGVSAATASARLRALTSAGLLHREQRFHQQPSSYLATKAGLALLGSPLPPPRFDVRHYEHDAGLAWLALAARSGSFGRLQEVIPERQLRSRDGRAASTEDPLGIRLGSLGPAGHRRLHYPDLLLVDPDGRRIAVELELTAKGRRRQEQILAGYAADGRTDVVLYLVRDAGLARSIATSARRLGISHRVHVQRVRFQTTAPGPDDGVVAQRRRAAGRAQRAALEGGR